MIETITYPQAVEVIRAIKGPQPFSATALTEPEMRKTGNPYAGKVRKLSRVSGFIADYENMVNNQLDREGKDQLTFNAKPRKWGRKVSLALVEHVKDGETRHYISFVPQHSKPFYLIATALGLMLIEKAILAPWMPEHKAPTNQGTDKAIEPRDYNLANVSSFRVGGHSYRIRHA
jgi:hypothetical protein